VILNGFEREEATMAIDKASLLGGERATKNADTDSCDAALPICD
jgi:hypothetical protein